MLKTIYAFTQLARMSNCVLTGISVIIGATCSNLFIFENGHLCFLTRDGALGVKMGGRDLYGRHTSFKTGLRPSKYAPENQTSRFCLEFWMGARQRGLCFLEEWS